MAWVDAQSSPECDSLSFVNSLEQVLDLARLLGGDTHGVRQDEQVRPTSRCAAGSRPDRSSFADSVLGRLPRER